MRDRPWPKPKNMKKPHDAESSNAQIALAGAVAGTVVYAAIGWLLGLQVALTLLVVVGAAGLAAYLVLQKLVSLGILGKASTTALSGLTRLALPALAPLILLFVLPTLPFFVFGQLKERDRTRLAAVVQDAWRAGCTFDQTVHACHIVRCWPWVRADFVDQQMADLVVRSPRSFTDTESFSPRAQLLDRAGIAFVISMVPTLLVALFEILCIQNGLIKGWMPTWTLATFAGCLAVAATVALIWPRSAMVLDDGFVTFGDKAPLAWRDLAISATRCHGDAITALESTANFASAPHAGIENYHGRRYVMALALASLHVAAPDEARRVVDGTASEISLAGQ